MTNDLDKVEEEEIPVSRLDRIRDLCDERYLVCEGAACNPDIRDYDDIRERYAMFGDNLSQLRERVKGLNHTLHVGERIAHYDIRMGWIKTFRCQRCGRLKRF